MGRHLCRHGKIWDGFSGIGYLGPKDTFDGGYKNPTYFGSSLMSKRLCCLALKERLLFCFWFAKMKNMKCLSILRRALAPIYSRFLQQIRHFPPKHFLGTKTTIWHLGSSGCRSKWHRCNLWECWSSLFEDVLYIFFVANLEDIPKGLYLSNQKTMTLRIKWSTYL